MPKVYYCDFLFMNLFMRNKFNFFGIVKIGALKKDGEYFAGA